MMLLAEVTADIVQIAGAVAAICAAIVSIKSLNQSRINTNKLDDTNNRVNGRVDELIKLREEIGYKRGYDDAVSKSKN